MRTLAFAIVLPALAMIFCVQKSAGTTDGESPAPDSGDSVPTESEAQTNVVVAVQSPAHWLGFNASGLILDVITDPRTATVKNCRSHVASAEESSELLRLCRTLNALQENARSQQVVLAEGAESETQIETNPRRRLRGANTTDSRSSAPKPEVAQASSQPFLIRALRINWWLPDKPTVAGEADYIDYNRAPPEARKLINRLRDIAATGDELRDVRMIAASSEDRRFGPEKISYAELHRLGGREFVKVSSAELTPDLTNIHLAAEYPGCVELVDSSQLSWLRRSKGWSGEANLFEIDGHCLTIEAWLSPAFQFRPGSTPFRPHHPISQPPNPAESP